MKKILIIIVLSVFTGKVSCNAQVKKLDCNDTYLNGELIEQECDSVLYLPNWQGLQRDLYDTAHASTFSFAVDNAKPNYWSSLLKCITDGENHNSTPQTFLYLLIKCQIPFTQTQKNEINAILNKNFFAIQL